MRKLYTYSFTVLFLSFFWLSGCASTSKQPSATSLPAQGIFWKIQTDPSVAPSYLFGTIHSEDPRVLTLPPAVEAAYVAANTLALEIELDDKAAGYAARTMFFNNGQTLKKVAGEDLYEQAVNAMVAKGVQADQVLQMKPWAVFTMLNMPEAETGVFLDVMLFQRMKQRGGKVVGLETIQEQVATLDEMPMKVQLALLSDTLARSDELDQLMDETIEIYLSRDLQRIESLNDDFLKEVPADIAHIFTERLIVLRNERMLQRMKPLLLQGNAFIAVGALHLPGEKGLLNLLRNSDYQIQPLY